MDRKEAATELNDAIEEMILAAVRAQDALQYDNLTADECRDWTGLLGQFRYSMEIMLINLETPHRSKEMH